MPIDIGFEILQGYLHVLFLFGIVVNRKRLIVSQMFWTSSVPARNMTFVVGSNGFARCLQGALRRISLLSEQYLLYIQCTKHNSSTGSFVLQLLQEARMLQTVLQKAMNDRGLSSHTAAEEIGCSHTTILRALRGERVDVDTIIKIANWLKIRPSELLNSMADTSLADQIAVLLSHSRELEAELKDAVERVEAGVLDPAVLRDIVSYALYKLNTAGADNVGHSTTGTRGRARETA